MMGKTMDEIARLLAPENADPAAFSGFVHDSFSYECEYLSTHPGSLFPGELDVLKELSQKYDLYIVSNAQAGYIENFTAILPYPYIKDHMCWDDTKKEKAVTIQALMARHGIAKEDAVYVGDTSKDRDAAFGAGIPFIYCLFGFEKKPREDEPTLRAFQELPAALERIFKGN